MVDKLEKGIPVGRNRFAGTLVLGLLFSLALSYGVVHSRWQEHQHEFLHDAKGATRDYAQALLRGGELLANFGLLFESSAFVTEEEFLGFVRPQMGVGDFVGVSFLALSARENPYSTFADEGRDSIDVVQGGTSYRFVYRYMAHSEQGMEQHTPAMHLMHSLGDNYRQMMPRAIAAGEAVLGGLVSLQRKNDTLVFYQPVYRQQRSERQLLGMLAVLVNPLAALEQVQLSHRLNAQLLVEGLFVGESRWGELAEGKRFILQHEEGLVLKGSNFQLVYSRDIGWADLGTKGAVVAFLLGLLLTFFAYRLREAAAARLRLSLERNRVIRRKVDEQTLALRQSNAELRQQKAALDEHAIVSIADPGGNIIYVNDRFCSISGYQREELLGRNHRLIKSAHHSAEFYAEMWATISAGQVWHGDICNLTKSGEEYWVHSTIVPFLDERGEPYQYVSIRTEFTELKRVTEGLQAREQELDTILNTVPALIWFKDRDGYILRINRQAASLLGHTPEQMVGRTMYEFFPEDAERYRATDLQVMQSGEPLLGQMEEKELAGGHYHFRLDRMPYRDPLGEVIGMVTMATDMTKQVQMKAELLANEERLRRSQDFANIGTWDWNIQSGELFWSEPIAALFGYEVGKLETSYENFLKALHPDDRERVSSAVTACIEQGTEYNIEHRVVWPDGQVRWVSEKGDVVRDKQGQPLHMLGLVQDIHSRKMAEEELNRFKMTLDMTQDCIFMFDAESLCYFYANQGAIEQVGYSAEEFWQLHPYDLKPDYDEASFRELVAPLVAEGGGLLTFDTSHQHKDGHVFPVEVGLQYIAPVGEAPRFVSIVRNIAERKAMSETLGRQKQLLDVLHATTSKFVVGSDFRETAEELLAALLELTGSEFGFSGELFHMKDGSPYLKSHAITNIAWDEESRARYEEYAENGFEFRNLDTLFGHVMSSGAPVISNDPPNDPRSGGLPEGHPPMHSFLGVPIYYGNEMVGMYGIANREGGYDEALLEFLRPFDATYGVIIHSKRIAELEGANRKALLAAKREAELANKAKSEFLSSMSHELRTPMNAILGFTQLIADDQNLTPEQRESLHDIAGAGNHLLELINDVLDLAKIEAGKIEICIGTVVLQDVISAVESLIMPMAQKRGIRVEFTPSCRATGAILADFTRTKQILLNLLSNAVKYNRDGGGITVECQCVDEERMRISVRDTGKGIAADRLQGLFEAFNRLDAEGGSIEGTGIGLVISRQLVELMDGAIGVESVEGEGSTFWFDLPCSEAADEASRGRPIAETLSQDEPLGAGCSMLYIEDNPVNLKLVTKLVAKRTALQMLSAEEPHSGLQLARQHRPDLILLDINLPQMSGYEVLQRLREMDETRTIPVVALSANAMASDLERGRAAGFDGYLTKPINVREFLAELERFLR